MHYGHALTSTVADCIKPPPALGILKRRKKTIRAHTARKAGPTRPSTVAECLVQAVFNKVSDSQNYRPPPSTVRLCVAHLRCSIGKAVRMCGPCVTSFPVCMCARISKINRHVIIIPSTPQSTTFWQVLGLLFVELIVEQKDTIGSRYCIFCIKRYISLTFLTINIGGAIISTYSTAVFTAPLLLTPCSS